MLRCGWIPFDLMEDLSLFDGLFRLADVSRLISMLLGRLKSESSVKGSMR